MTSKEYLDQIRRSPLAFFINRSRLTILLFVAMLIYGLISITSIPQEITPEIKIPYGIVTAVYPGASPGDMEELVTNELEKKIDELNGIEEITSTSSTGFSMISVEFEADEDVDNSIRNLKDKVDEARSKLPKDMDMDPTVTELRIDEMPIITYSLTGNYPEITLKDYAEGVQDEVEGLPGVDEVVIQGLRQREWRIELDRQKMELFEVPLLQLTNLLGADNVDYPLGEVDIAGSTYPVRMTGQFDNSDEILNLPISNYQGKTIYIRDIGQVYNDFAAATTYSRVCDGCEVSQPSLSLLVYKSSGGSVIDIVDRSNEIVDKYQAEVLPDGMEIIPTTDNAEYTRDSISNLVQQGVFTAAIIVILLFFSLGFREALMNAIGLPMIILISFIPLYFLDRTINVMSMFGVILSIGMIVDTSIVVTESMNDKVKQGLKIDDASRATVFEFFKPLFSSTLTTISAFIPMLLVSGILGAFIKVIPIMVIFTLSASMWVAFVFLPLLALFVFRKGGASRPGKISVWLESKKGGYGSFLQKLLANRAKRWMVIIGVIVAFFLSMSIPASGILPSEMFPEDDSEVIILTVTAPAGTSLEETSRLTALLEDKIKDVDQVTNFVTLVGGGGGRSATTNYSKASLTINLTDKDDRRVTSQEILANIRKVIDPIEGVEITLEANSDSPTSEKPVNIRVIGDDFDEIIQATRQVEQLVKSIPETKDVDTNIEEAAGEWVYTLQRDKLRYYGVTASEVGGFVRNALYGIKASEVNEGDDTIDIVARYPENEFDSIDDVSRLLVTTPQGNIPLSELTSVSLEPTVTSINHENRRRVLTVQADVDGKTSKEIQEEVQELIASKSFPDGIYFEYGGEQEEINESFAELGNAMIVAVILILFILVMQFGSFRQTAVILLTIPMAMIGVYPSLLLIGVSLSFPVMIGMIALIGIVVNNAIVLIDKFNHNRQVEGMPIVPAVVEGASSRFRPILLTTMTTIAGMPPLVMADKIWGGIGYTIGFGLLFAAILTLVIVPILYVQFAREKENAA